LRRDGRALVFNPEVPSMTKISSLITATAIASLLLMGAASAQTAAPAATKTEAPKTDTKTDTKAPAAKRAEKPRTPGSLECSKQADEKGLKGKERKKFRNACKKEAADKEKAAAGAK
jgi:psiF repeat-containing protein